jgi:hypothetical protein
MKFYRYYESAEYPAGRDFNGEYTFSHSKWKNALPNVNIHLEEFDLIKFTPKGYWIGGNGFKKWVSATSLKKFAYPTLQEALTSFRLRKEQQVRILKAQLYVAEIAFELSKTDSVKEMLPNAGIFERLYL